MDAGARPFRRRRRGSDACRVCGLNRSVGRFVAVPDVEAPRSAGELRSTDRCADQVGNGASYLRPSVVAAARRTRRATPGAISAVVSGVAQVVSDHLPLCELTRGRNMSSKIIPPAPADAALRRAAKPTIVYPAST